MINYLRNDSVLDTSDLDDFHKKLFEMELNYWGVKKVEDPQDFLETPFEEEKVPEKILKLSKKLQEIDKLLQQETVGNKQSIRDKWKEIGPLNLA